MNVILQLSHQVTHLLFGEQVLVLMEAAASIPRLVEEVFACVDYVADAFFEDCTIQTIFGTQDEPEHVLEDRFRLQ